jgi:hypothetical protein
VKTWFKLAKIGFSDRLMSKRVRMLEVPNKMENFLTIRATVNFVGITSLSPCMYVFSFFTFRLNSDYFLSHINNRDPMCSLGYRNKSFM